MPKLANFTWDEAAIIQIEALWLAGFSGSEIAERMGGGLTRNAVIGKAHRLGLPGKHRRQRRRAAKAPARLLEIEQPVLSRPEKPSNKRSVQVLEFVKSPVPELPPVPVIGSFDMLDLRHKNCRWPEGDYPPFLFCGALVVEGYPYCRDHAVRCYPKGFAVTI